MTAAVATAVAAQPMKTTGTSTIRAVPRWRMVSRIAAYSVCCRGSNQPKSYLMLAILNVEC
jgi:hypothetical protein